MSEHVLVSEHVRTFARLDGRTCVRRGVWFWQVSQSMPSHVIPGQVSQSMPDWKAKRNAEAQRRWELMPELLYVRGYVRDRSRVHFKAYVRVHVRKYARHDARTCVKQVSEQMPDFGSWTCIFLNTCRRRYQNIWQQICRNKCNNTFQDVCQSCLKELPCTAPLYMPHLFCFIFGPGWKQERSGESCALCFVVFWGWL